MRVEITSKQLQSDFVKEVEKISGENVIDCYQCGKCSAGCPMVFAMDILPNQVMRLMQLGLEEDVTKSNTIWVCASCVICTARCPRGCDLARVMEAVRTVALRKRFDYVDLTKIPPDIIDEIPQIALVGSFRKHTC